MTYNQILKQRRLALKLSIQDISSQTRLAPEYIEAIEENNLDVFSNDFTFVRYFVHAYCDAIGVNWQAIQLEVEQSIKYYAHQKNMEMTQLQKKIVDTEVSSGSKSKKRRGKKTNHLQKIFSKKWSKKKISRMAIICIIAIVTILGVSNIVINSISSRQQDVEEQKRQEELKRKEAETQKLAEQKKEQEFKEFNKDLEIVPDEEKVNAFIIYTGSKKQTELEFHVNLPKKSKVVLYKGEELETMDFNKVYKNEFVYRVKVKSNCTLHLKIDSFDKNKIFINGKNIAYDDSIWQEGDAAEIKFKVVLGSQSEEDNFVQSDDETQEEVEDPYTDEATDPYGQMYETDPYGEKEEQW